MICIVVPFIVKRWQYLWFCVSFVRNISELQVTSQFMYLLHLCPTFLLKVAPFPPFYPHTTLWYELGWMCMIVQGYSSMAVRIWTWVSKILAQHSNYYTTTAALESVHRYFVQWLLWDLSTSWGIPISEHQVQLILNPDIKTSFLCFQPTPFASMDIHKIMMSRHGIMLFYLSQVRENVHGTTIFIVFCHKGRVCASGKLLAPIFRLFNVFISIIKCQHKR